MSKTIGVYYLTDGLHVLYVGKSVHVEQRVRQWQYSQQIDFSQVFVDRCEASQLNELEAKAIAEYDPPFNRVTNCQP